MFLSSCTGSLSRAISLIVLAGFAVQDMAAIAQNPLPYTIEPPHPAPGQEITIRYRPSFSTANIRFRYGFNGWNAIPGTTDQQRETRGGNTDFFADIPMKYINGNIQTSIRIPPSARSLHFVFCWNQCGPGEWDNNEEKDYALSLSFPYSGPYLTWTRGMDTSTAILVNFETPAPEKTAVEYGSTPQLGAIVESDSIGRLHHIPLTNLEPATTYFYRIAGQSGRVSDIRSFRTLPDPTTSARLEFVVLGDVADNGEAGFLTPLMQTLRNQLDGVDFILITGNLTYSNRPGHWWTFFNHLDPILASVPILAVPGPRDEAALSGAADRRAFRDYFPLPYVDNTNKRLDWRFTHGSLLILGTDAISSSISSATRQWLTEELETRREITANDAGVWTMVASHIPPFSAGARNPSAQYGMRPLTQTFQGVVDWHFAGHDNVFQRTRPLDSNGRPVADPNGYGVEFGKGTGFIVMPAVGLPPASDLVPLSTEDGLCRQRLAFPETESHLNASNGFVRIRIEGEQISVTTFRVDTSTGSPIAYIWDSTAYSK